mmetsp:Transcript_24715/g.53915  ORF Transcript_24715/g.53915 Transcript_24715/m.53915 type:complete len:247 (+) Transcript_24715:1892-2632(+)
MLSHTAASPGCIAHCSIRRPMMSCETTVSTTRSPPTRLARWYESMLESSTTMCPSRPSASRRPASDSSTRSARASADSSESPTASTMMDRARDADTLWRSCRRRGDPERQMISEPRRESSLNCNSMSRSISSLLRSDRITTLPPPSLSLASESCFTMGSSLSLHPRMSEWFVSSTALVPFLRSSIFSPMASDTSPSINAVTSMPPTAVAVATSRTWVDTPPTECSFAFETKVQSRPTPATASHAEE